MNAPGLCRELIENNGNAVGEGCGSEVKVVQDVSGGDKFATMVVEVEGVRFNVSVSQITKARGQKTSYV